MSGLVLQTQAVKVLTQQGFVHPKTKKRVRGSDYVVFNCPGCGRRNKQCVHQVLYAMSSGELVFRCNQFGCGREIEVRKPDKEREARKGRIIVTPQEFEAEKKASTLDEQSLEQQRLAKLRQGQVTIP